MRRGRVPMRRPYLMLIVIDALLGANYLLLDRTHFTGHGWHEVAQVCPIPVWGGLYLALALGLTVLSGKVRDVWCALLGIGVNVVLGLAFAITFLTGLDSHDPASHTSAGFPLLLFGWGLRHYLTGRHPD